ncbi:nicotinic acid mononucleotide adenyltransferase [Winogradskyella psychrotolerans]|uniref:toxin-antitoxin system YwqK family antitoxin n=1 Tax=Winogradskyella psychrotolerans TaxID=1344585 RepID=UPI001C077AA7|nr:nicotinic acid mononucleotide adenyltransferase [Winogradskyella psychrotolerans]MBU2922571.1 nicotinic acid mononucleotide adenyltransferase [Winogradskyella psychrotolerans]
MKKIVIILVMLSVGFTYAQNKNKPQLEKKGDLLIATYFHDNGAIQQTGAFDANGKLQGKWTSFDVEGNKLAVATYDAGKKVGKWFFWEGDSLKEVDYRNNAIVSVVEWSNDRTLVSLD